jgi:hypothetical protein|nr:MAG TPA: hypothetical protein [Caudoviricetes sp.]
MISVDKGHVQMSGKGIEMLAELGVMAAALYEMMCEKGISKGTAEKVIHGVVVAGICSKETFGKKENSIMEMANEIVKKTLKGEKDDE